MEQVVTDKTDFLISLGGKRELKRILNELVKEHELLRIKIEELVGRAIAEEHDLDKNWPTMRVLYKMPDQHKVLFDTDCDESPYGMHGKASLEILEDKCIWCHCELD